MHRFFRGMQADEEEYSDYVSTSQIDDMRSKYNIYDTICGQIKNSLSCTPDRNKDSLIGELMGKAGIGANAKGVIGVQGAAGKMDMQSAIYLQQALQESNCLDRKKLLRLVAKQLHLIG